MAIRLGTEGKNDVTRDFREVGEAGDAAAARASKSFDKAASDFESAERRMAAAAAKIAAIMPQTAVQMQINDSVGTGSTLNEGSARVSAAAFRELYAEQERLTAGAAALRAQLDPAWAAQQRFNTEMSQARTLVAAGVITLDEYCDKLRIERTALDEVSRSHVQATSSAGAMRAGMQNLGFQAQDFIVQVLGGTDALRAFAMQAPQAIGAIQMMANSTEGGNSKFAAMANILSGPVGIALGVAIPLVVMLGERFLTSGDAADSMAKRQSALAGMIDQTTGRLKEQNQALLQNQVLLAKTDASKAQSGFNDTRQALRNMRPGDVDLANIARFAADTGQTSRAAQMLQQLSKEKPWLAEQAQSMNGMLADMTSQARTIVQAQAQARLLSGAGRAGDAKRAFGDFSSGATSYNMTEIDAQAKLAAATTEVDKATAQLTLTRQRAEEQLKAGKITQEQATAQIADAERALDRAQASEKARREAATAGRKAENAAKRQDAAEERRIIADRKAVNDWLYTKITEASKNATAALAADAEKIADQQKAFRAANDNISAGNILLNVEWEMRGKSRREIEAAVELKREQLRIEREIPGATQEQIDQLLKAKAAQIAFTNAIDDSNAKMEALRDIGSNVVDTVLNPSNWTSWKNVGLAAINDVVSALWKMAVINPIQNQLTGSSLPTIGNLLGLFGKKSSGGSAIGNSYTPAGAMLVGENGPEIVNMPRGAQVLTASDSRRMMAGNDNGLQIRVIKGDLFDVEVAQISAGVSADTVATAAPLIAVGASNGAQQAVAKRSGRRLA
ncbi:hypothetical protein [Sphingobium yanoikuyae]|uniref:hypothetical protein n=1 Tax=Sphingobium yanoikuyae TaxID=13690 RepID=UPI0022DE4AF0|nr:hypothetical protein [Sphingobium yanoikuyae]WBQ17467.1 hypothetical protein PAE53_04480 [Sphingobium yanoikuyae]